VSTWRQFGCTWRTIGPTWRPFGATWRPFGVTWRPLGALGDPKGRPRTPQDRQKGAKAAPRVGFYRILDREIIREQHFLQICREQPILQKPWFYLGESIDFEGSAA